MVTTTTRLMVLAGALAAGPAAALTIEFDYRYDRSGFFSEPGRRALLEQAAQAFAGLADPLAAIQPGGGDTWSATFRHPSWSSIFETATVIDETVAARNFKVFVGASGSVGSVLGIADPGTTTATGSPAFVDLVAARGQAGALAAVPTDFGPWGGSIWFNRNASWHFGADTSGLEPGESDFLTTATHELAHLLGIGEAASWSALVTGGPAFTGTQSQAFYGGPVPLDPIAAHWAEGTMSVVNGRAQETLMDPTTVRGIREDMTALDYAGLADIGWQVSAVPEPAAWVTMILGILGLGAWSRRRSQPGDDSRNQTDSA
jgi:hypothetical protein